MMNMMPISSIFPEECYGDYIILDIEPDSTIANWEFNPDTYSKKTLLRRYKEFMDYVT
ncbi:hypothetical protein R83H12_01664 [Fibrobacteria bacterium R8-3-H12]